MREKNPQNMAEAIGLVIYYRRHQTRLTQAELAKRARVSQATISLIEEGEGDPRVFTIQKICEALGVKISKVALEAESLLALKK
jgi:transcriptional regulator with XRE-family HTH domain